MRINLKITLSKQNYREKPKRYNLIKLNKQVIEDLEDFYDKISSGYGFSSNFYDHDEEFVSLTDEEITLHKELQKKRNRFLRRITENIPNIKINSVIENFHLLDFEKFIIEINKQKIKLSLLQQDEWEEYFNYYKEECSKLANAITAADSKIDELVYQLYNLTEEEIKVVENI